MRKVRPLPLAAARWTSGFWADRFAQCRDVMVPTMGRLMSDSERFKFVGNFEVACGIAEGRHRGPKWNDGDFYKWLEAASALLAFASDEKRAAQIDSYIELIARTQDADGYIHTDVQIAQRAGGNAKRFANPIDFEMYNMGHLMTAACVHHAATGKTNLLAVARKAADFLARTFADPTPQQARHGICPSHLMGLIDLHAATGDARYRDLAVKLLKIRDLVVGGDDDNQDRVPLRQETRAVGHAVRGTYLWSGAADIAAETDDASLVAALSRIWDDLVQHKLYITGGCGALYDGASPDGAVDQKTITRVHQAFGRPYQLPQSTAHNETCAAIGNLMWNWRMFQLTGEARFCDIIEQTLYNSVLAGISLDGTAFFYTNTLRQLDPMPVELRWGRRRQKSIGCFCCPPNVVRTIAQSSRYAYAESDGALYVVLYGASTLETERVKLTQETDYPWDGRVRITIDAAPREELTIYLRIPGWVKDARISLNERLASVAGKPGSFFEIRRAWQSGDVIDIDFPMPARLVEAHPYVEEARNHVAVMRGPIVYCLESVDLPRGVRVLDVHLPREPQLTARPMRELASIVALEGKGIAIPSEQWSGQLYRDFQPRDGHEFHLIMIPYFAWDNRGQSEMTVWLP